MFRMFFPGGGVKSLRISAIRGAAIAATAFSLSVSGLAQDAQPTTQAAASPQNADTQQAVHDLQEQVRQLRSMVDQMHTENVQSRAEMQQLRQELKATRSLLEKPATPSTNQYAASQPALPDTQMTSGFSTAEGADAA